MGRRILLIEPNYKNKYPPIGLMKISTYHKKLGDEVQFFKGNLNDLLTERRLFGCLKELGLLTTIGVLADASEAITNYLKYRRLNFLAEIKGHFIPEDQKAAESILKYYAYKYIPIDYWDRIYITTLFTFYWKITIKTIEFAKKLVSDNSRILVGGVMASLLNKEIEVETGIVPFAGLLDQPGILDANSELIIDELTLDYSILDEIEYKYPTQSAYFTFMTKGCTRKCSFCSVPKLEPTYKSKIESIEKFQEVTKTYGEQRNLLLMDNNVLASPKFPEIIKEIKDMGFYKGATFVEPNQLDISIRNLKSGLNDKAYIKRSYELIHKFYKKLKGPNKEKIRNILTHFKIIDFKNATKNSLLEVYPHISEIYERYRTKNKILRYVDFNQGTDARYVTDELMRLMSEIPIKPLRIAFDHISIQKQYINAVELAAKYDIKELSNYILFNFQDKPEDFYKRLRINIDLGKRLNISIFSFPMKYVPLFGEEAKGRKYIGTHWNKKFLRTIQTILIATKGIVAPGYEFFEMAYGKNIDEFMDLLYMPEAYIINRNYFEINGLKGKWKKDFNDLNEIEALEAKKIIEDNEFLNIERLSSNIKILRVLSHYKFYDDKIIVDIEVKKLRNKFNKLINQDMFINLTLTHDFELPLTSYRSA